MLISMNKMESTQYNAAYTLINVWKKRKRLGFKTLADHDNPLHEGLQFWQINK